MVGPSALAHGSALFYLKIVKPYSKPFMPVTSQLVQIQARGMGVSDEERALKYLETTNYYRLSGYWFPLRQSRVLPDDSGKPTTEVLDVFRKDANFEQVIDLYEFDKKLRLLMLDALERIEIALRTDVALQLGQHDPWAHRKPDFLDGKFSTEIRSGKHRTRFADFLLRVDKTAADSREDFVTHFRFTYSDPLPIWAAVELWDFGCLSIFFSGMKYRDQRAIAGKYEIGRPELLPTWVRTLAFVRNVCAHHGRLWNKPLIAVPKEPRKGEVPLLDHLAGDSFARERLYSAAAIAQYLHRYLAPDLGWSAKFVSLIGSFPNAPGVHIGQAGFPDGWSAQALWAE